MLDTILVSLDWMQALVYTYTAGRCDSEMLVVVTYMVRVTWLLRLLRLSKCVNTRDSLLEHIRSEGAKIVAWVVAVLVALVALIHIIACIWFMIWTKNSFGCTQLAAVETAIGVSGSSRAHQYLEAFHFVLALFVGEHIALPQGSQQRIFVVVVLILAFVVTASFVGSLTTAMTRLQIIASRRSGQFAQLNRYLADCGISSRLSLRVQRNARHALRERKRKTQETSVELLQLISDTLRSEIHYEQLSPTLLRHPFFNLYNRVHPCGLRHICHTSSHSSASLGAMLFFLSSRYPSCRGCSLGVRARCATPRASPSRLK